MAQIEAGYWLNFLLAGGKGLELTIHHRQPQNVKLLHEPKVRLFLSGCSGCETVEDFLPVIETAISSNQELRASAKFHAPIK